MNHGREYFLVLNKSRQITAVIKPDSSSAIRNGGSSRKLRLEGLQSFPLPHDRTVIFSTFL